MTMNISNLWLWLSISHMKKMHAESIYSALNFSAIKCGKFLIQHVRDQQYISVDYDHLMLGEVNSAFFSDCLAANDILLFVDPAARGKGLSPKLISDFTTWAQSQNAKLITLSQSTGCANTAFNSAMKKFNYQSLGTVYGRASCVEEK